MNTCRTETQTKNRDDTNIFILFFLFSPWKITCLKTRSTSWNCFLRFGWKNALLLLWRQPPQDPMTTVCVSKPLVNARVPAFLLVVGRGSGLFYHVARPGNGRTSFLGQSSYKQTQVGKLCHHTPGQRQESCRGRHGSSLTSLWRPASNWLATWDSFLLTTSLVFPHFLNIYALSYWLQMYYFVSFQSNSPLISWPCFDLFKGHLFVFSVLSKCWQCSAG